MKLDDLRTQPHISASEMRDFLECGLAYKFGRIDGIEPEFKPASMLFGSCIHQALAQFYRVQRQGHEMELDDLLECFSTVWTEEAKQTGNLQYRKDESFESLSNTGRGLLEAFHRDLPRERFRVLDVELPFSFRIEGVEVPVIGAMDLVLLDESGTVVVVDHKTRSKSPTRAEIDQSLQLSVYHMAVRSHGFADAEILLRADCLIKTKTPKFEQCYTSRSELDIRRAVGRIRSAWDAIQREAFVPAPGDSWKCGCCAFKTHCADWLANR